VLVGWSTRDDLEELYGDVVAVWRPWAVDIRGVAIESGHHVAEEAPESFASALVEFLDDQPTYAG
jgi:haloacetate dehalogenase